MLLSGCPVEELPIKKNVSEAINPFAEDALAIFGPECSALIGWFENEYQLEALKFLDKKHKVWAVQFKNKYQLQALKILGQEGISLALQFTNQDQIYALKKLGVRDANLALKFSSLVQIKAFLLLGRDKLDLALKYTSFFQTQALEFFKSSQELDLAFTSRFDLTNKLVKQMKKWKEQEELALSFKNSLQFMALKSIGTDKTDLALEFSGFSQLNALEKLGPKNADYALKFKTNTQVKALNKVGVNHIELALLFTKEKEVINLTNDPCSESSKDAKCCIIDDIVANQKECLLVGFDVYHAEHPDVTTGGDFSNEKIVGFFAGL